MLIIFHNAVSSLQQLLPVDHCIQREGHPCWDPSILSVRNRVHLESPWWKTICRLDHNKLVTDSHGIVLHFIAQHVCAYGCKTERVTTAIFEVY